MSYIKINVDPYLFSENTDGSFKIRFAKSSTVENGLSLQDGIVTAVKGSDGTGGNPSAGNKVGNGIVGIAYEKCNGQLGCHRSVSRRRKAPSSNTFAVENDGVYIPDIIRHLNSNYGDD